MAMENPADLGQHPQRLSEVERFAREYGWWRVVAIPVMVVITVWVLVDVFRSPAQEAEVTAAGETSTSSATATPSLPKGPDPANASAIAAAKDGLPAGGAFTEQGDETYRDAGPSTMHAGKGGKQTIRFSVEIENGVDTSTYGGDAAVVALVDATLSDPRGWTANGDFEFIHVKAEDNPDTHIRLTSLGTTAKLCGAQLESETSCHTTITGESAVNLNESRWVRGAAPFEGDLGNYRQYLINHEFGHAIGYAAHQPCGGEGNLAPVMMQQTLSLNNGKLFEKEPNEVYPDEDVTCEPNPWPYPNPANSDHAKPE
ncbi:DUF3152 domain-containing protein [Corynebacterium sp. HMSC068G04]|uniref:DUF3152 domain-containing protein n=1 Tax=Corynebacterium sp. HMSC068G04 TaxID=1739497 RepID=UPI0008A53DB6|nr:DUF3152 domain-containing protein [Corynebacterium sp. HMSC068G04]OFP26516.1 hypothetical protein HMPREF2993_03695 [Corynebacterium sp. HMSC068G04]